MSEMSECNTDISLFCHYNTALHSQHKNSFRLNTKYNIQSSLCMVYSYPISHTHVSQIPLETFAMEHKGETTAHLLVNLVELNVILVGGWENLSTMGSVTFTHLTQIITI